MLVAVVAAMVILVLAGTALSELFGAQRLEGALSVESARAYWIAEAGIWEAEDLGASITTPITYAGGQFTVVLSGSTYTATGTFHDATRVVSLTIP